MIYVISILAELAMFVFKNRISSYKWMICNTAIQICFFKPSVMVIQDKEGMFIMILVYMAVI